MKTTQHIQSRMQQRSITKDELDLVMAFGEPKGDKVILNKRRTDELLKQYEYYLQHDGRK